VRRALFAVLAAALSVAAVEAFARLLLAPQGDTGERLRAAAYLPAGAGDPFPGARAGPVDKAVARVARLGSREVIHPYLGFVTRPEDGAEGLEALGLGRGPFVRERPQSELVIGVFGGSVARLFVEDGGADLVFPGATVLRFAHDSYKAPQPMIQLALYLALGGKLDVVLLLNGFNDVALPVAENAALGVHPLWPYWWAYRVADLNLAIETRALIGEIAFLGRRREAMARWLLGSPLRHSGVIRTFWLGADRWLEGEIAGHRAELRGEASKALDYMATGPRWKAGPEALLPDLVTAWREESLSMHAACTARGIRFVHALQPNQYAGGKPIGDEERAVAVRRDHPYRRWVETGYPLLREAGGELRAAGVEWIDLSESFADHPDPLYIDDCCHVGPEGNRLLAAAMASSLADPIRP
jgi:hypothetical protein